MRLYKRRPGPAAPYWFAFSHRGRKVRRSTGTTDRDDAQEYADRFRADLWRADKLGERAAVTWDAAALEWLEKHQKLRALADRKDQLRFAKKYLTGKPLAAIDRDLLETIADKKAATGVSDATVNRHLAAISAVLGYAVTRGWLSSRPSIPRRQESEKRVRWATHEKAAKLVTALPPHLAPMAAFSLATGLRRKNVMRLEWPAVDLRRRLAWVHADEAKGKRTFTIPLSDAAIAILQAQRGVHRRVVFPYNGRAMDKQGAPAWRAACKAAGLRDFHWHDLRHTWASWHVQNGTPLPVLKELGGWRSLSMVMRYAHLAPSHLADYAGNGGAGEWVQKWSHGRNGGKAEKAA